MKIGTKNEEGGCGDDRGAIVIGAKPVHGLTTLLFRHVEAHNLDLGRNVQMLVADNECNPRLRHLALRARGFGRGGRCARGGRLAPLRSFIGLIFHLPECG